MPGLHEDGRNEDDARSDEMGQSPQPAALGIEVTHWRTMRVRAPTLRESAAELGVQGHHPSDQSMSSLPVRLIHTEEKLLACRPVPNDQGY